MALYHDLEQGYRIQKRLALNQCYRNIFSDVGVLDNLTYVTFGGEDLFDLLDLVYVFDVREHKINVFSFEEDAAIAQQALNCPVAATLSQLNTVKINVIADEFSSRLNILSSVPKQPSIYYLDYTKVFSDREKDCLVDLFQSALLRIGDYFLITSSLNPRVVHQSTFCDHLLTDFRIYYPTLTLTKAFKVRNHVDLNVQKAVVEASKYQDLKRNPKLIGAQLLRKIRYNDTSAMGLWLFKVCEVKSHAGKLHDIPFEDFPSSFSPVPPRDRINIFE